MSANAATGLAITNPLVKYRALVATKQIVQDPAQIRLALHLQKLYEDLKDYEPQIEYSVRLDQISRAVNSWSNGGSTAKSRPPSQGGWRSFLGARERRNSLALTRKLTSHDGALNLTSPKGLMLHGEVGTGKSMLIDLFADCLPTRKKRRWHFNTFMLETFAKLESLRRSRSIARTPFSDGDDYSLLWLAKDMIQTSPILFLDEFQMPDRTSSKILTNLMTSFFHLGGVLVATSNRMPEELAKAAGMQFPAPATGAGAFGWQFGLRRRRGTSDRLFGGQSESAAFLEVLKARCEVWEMDGAQDYRRMESGVIVPAREGNGEWQLDGHDDMQHADGMAGWSASEGGQAVVLERTADDMTANSELVVKLPMHFHVDLNDPLMEESVKAAVSEATGDPLANITWSSATMQVYGRTIRVPRMYKGVTMWTFEELCKTTLGPADYISLASTYDTIVLTDVPILTWLMKNEARRFITLLDALYECRCKLFVSAQAGPDDLFFPEKAGEEDTNGDAVYSETISEVYQDATAPFRPNVLTDNPNYAEPDPEPNYTHARLAGLLNADALEDDPPNRPRRNAFGRSFGRTDSEMERQPIDPDEPLYASRNPDFGKTSAFIGEDERFAYKRAESRLWEMCGARWWARHEPGWHRPLPKEVRRWEEPLDGPTGVGADLPTDASAPGADVTMGDAVIDDTRDERSFARGSASPFRTATEPPPKISWTHAWGLMRWGAKAGAWGRGVDGLRDRGNEKR